MPDPVIESYNPSQDRTASATKTPAIPPQKRFHLLPFITTFIILAFFWVLYSGRFDLFHISLGVISCLIIAAANQSLLFPSGITWRFIVVGLKFVGYIPWLLLQIFLANLHVLYLTFHPRMMDLIDPEIIEFSSRLKSDISRTTFANSITLTPGTITVNVSVLGKFAVHCIDEKSGQSLPGVMEKRIARVFCE